MTLQVTALWNSRAHYTEEEPTVFTILNNEKFGKTVIFFFYLFMLYNILQRKVKRIQLHTDIWLS